MATRDIRTHTPVTACDVCGRTLLRGERAEVFLDGGERRSVCELCKARALHEGWVREGSVPDFTGTENGRDHRRSLLRRLRSRRGRDGGRDGRRVVEGGFEWEPAETWDEEPLAPGAYAEEPPAPGGYAEEPPDVNPVEPSGDATREPAREPVPERTRRRRRVPGAPAPAVRRREPRHVRAVPTGAEQKRTTAIELFNASEHTRTIAGVARSLGAPTVAVQPSDERPSLVLLVVSWELCWYRYEVDLADEVPSVRPAGQGYELSELSEWEQQGNALADEQGALLPAG